MNIEPGTRAGRLVVVERAEPVATPGGRRLPAWRCRCDCGAVVVVPGQSLRGGLTRSCGCLRSEVSRQLAVGLNTTHAGAGSVEHEAWRGMRRRARNAGVRVHPAWRSFARFHADVGDKPSAVHRLARIDRCLPYQPGNVAWLATAPPPPESEGG